MEFIDLYYQSVCIRKIGFYDLHIYPSQITYPIRLACVHSHFNMISYGLDIQTVFAVSQ